MSATTNIGGVALGDLILAASQSPIKERSVTSTLTLTQAIASSFDVVTSNLSFSQSISYTRGFSRTVTSTLVQTDAIHVIKSQTVPQTLTLTQTISYEKSKPQTVPQSIGLVQALARSYVGKRLIVSGLEWSHTRQYNAVFNRTVQQSLSFSQSFVGDRVRTAASTLVLSQTISFNKLKHVKHTLEWQQSFVANTNYLRTINSVLGLSQQFNKTGTYNKSVNQSLALTQTIVQARVKGVTQTLNLTQTIVANVAKNVKNVLSLSQSVSYNHVSNRTVVSPLILNSQIGLTQSHRLSVLHGFGMNSFVRQWRVNTRTVSQNYAPAQTIRFNVFERTVVSTYAPSQSVSYTPVYPRSVNSVLGFNQTNTLNKVTSRTVSSILSFLPSRKVYIGMDNVDYFDIPNVQYAVVPAYLQGKKNRPHCVLQTNNAAITLPAPEWGDGENYGGVFTIRRSMNNIPYTHVRTLSLRKLQLPWVLAKRKAWELREFLIANNDKLMTLTTWKGDKWFVNLITNPLELVVRGRYANEDEKVSVELEFEGLKVM
jgi:hypothetical protein